MKPCTKNRLPRDVRTMWVFGMGREERRLTFPCRRPDGHRGDCLLHPHVPPEPLRPLVALHRQG